jgi:probable rRNA maturation factor
VSVSDLRGRRQSAGGLADWLAKVAPRSARGAVAVALVSDAAMRRLNREYTGHDYATDVLSFPVSPGPRAPGLGPVLGDIAIATGVARRQARERRHTVAVELRVLALHGLLHLLGYDHDRDRGEMHRVEERLRRKGGLREGLIARGAGTSRP